MNKDDIRLSDAIRHFGVRNFAVALLSLLIVGAIIISVFYALYTTTRENLWLQGELSAMQSADEFDKYLLMSLNAVKLSGYTVNELMESGATNEDILKFMMDETVNIQTTINAEYTGLYGWINGEYLDGAGWEPAADYVATERPWYVETMARKQEITFIRPYLDMDTGTIMMTITNLMRDGESVLALDVSLGRLQEITEAIAQNIEGSCAMVLDHSGGVVAHSDVSQLGHNYLGERGTLGNLIARNVFDRRREQFEMEYDGSPYAVYCQEIEGGWYSVCAINADRFFLPSRMVQFGAIFIVVMTTLTVFAIIVRVSKRNLMTLNLNTELSTLADIYETVYDIDLTSDTFRRIASREDVDKIVGSSHAHAQATFYAAMDQLTDEGSLALIREFVDLSTLNARLRERVSVTEEFLSSQGHWCRGRFIAAGRDAKGHLARALWLVESIDGEKRRRDELLHLSETDRMTGLFNRSCGENKIIALLSEGVGGMFMEVDADKFKHINDSYGHNVGDKVLLAVASALKGAFRSGDIVLRLGGDEFAAFAPGVVNAEVGRRIVERFYEGLARASIEELQGRPISVSIGAAFCADGEEISFRQLYERADQCVYISKKFDGCHATYYDETMPPAHHP